MIMTHEATERTFQPIELDSIHPGSAGARLAGYGVSVWALIGHFRLIGYDKVGLAKDFDLPPEAVDAALAYYDEHRDDIDARLRLHEAAFVA